MSVRLTYFVELRPRALVDLFADDQVIAGLRRSWAGVALAMIDFSEERRQIIARLNEAGIPVTAWLLLDERDGYWLTADNSAAARERYQTFRAWARANALNVARVGLDIEAPHHDSVALVEQGRQALFRLFMRRRSREYLRRGQLAYARLIDEIRRDGFFVETYQFPLVLDERRAGSTLLQQLFGFVDIRADREVIMLYESLLPPLFGDLLIDAYGPDCEAIAVGLTGGGVEFLQTLVGQRNLDQRTLSRALGRAARHCAELYVFSLEGCIAGGYFDALSRETIAATSAPEPLAPVARLARRLLQQLLHAGRLMA
jgi:hypothetical protein